MLTVSPLANLLSQLFSGLLPVALQCLALFSCHKRNIPRANSTETHTPELSNSQSSYTLLLPLLLRRCSRVRLCATPQRQPTRLPRPWDSPGKNTGVGCHFLLQGMKVKSESEVAQWCPSLGDPMDCSPPGSSIHGILQARGLEWGAIAFSALILAILKIFPHREFFSNNFSFYTCFFIIYLHSLQNCLLSPLFLNSPPVLLLSAKC